MHGRVGSRVRHNSNSPMSGPLRLGRARGAALNGLKGAGGMAHPDYALSNGVALALVVAVIAFLLFGYIGLELADLPPALGGSR